MLFKCLIYKKKKKVGAMAINILSMTYMVSFIPTIFPASYFIDKYGERNGFIVGAILNAVGSIVRVLPFPFYSISSSVPYSFYIVFIGQLLTALTQPFIIGLPPKIAQVCFLKNFNFLLAIYIYYPYFMFVEIIIEK